MSQHNEDYSEVLFEAVDEIIKERLNGIAFDQTVLCTIIDDSQRAAGAYTVEYSNTLRFTAYSADTSYRNNDNVYVKIPGGDWDQQKNILYKKTNDTIEPFNYKKPYDNVIDITGNLIHGSLPSNRYGLVANDASNKEILLWSYNEKTDDREAAESNDSGEPLIGYTRLGLSASFQSWLNPFYDKNNLAKKISKGEYGLRVVLKGAVEKVSEETNTPLEGKEQSKDQIQEYEILLNQDDMNGDPYNFDTFFQQEKVVDISGIGKINSIKIYFYQNPGSFMASDGTLISSTDFLGNIIQPNLFVTDTYISLGYDVSEVEEEYVTIFTLDSSTYSRTADPLHNNHKKIELRWIHKQEDGSFKSITQEDGLNFEIQWYRFELGHSSPDEYAGVYWKHLSHQTFDQNIHKYSYSIDDEDWERYNSGGDPTREPGFFYSWAIPDTTLQEEQYKAILKYNDKIYRSNILVCQNEDEVVSKPTVDAVQALSISCDDGTYGNYRIYNTGNTLLDRADGEEIRIFRPFFKSLLEKGVDANSAPTELEEAESIEWIIPFENTMIVVDPSFYESTDAEEKEGLKTEYIEDKKNGLMHIKRYGLGVKKNDLSNRNFQRYRIRPYYSQSFSNNTIQCKVVKEKITYTAIMQLNFGIAGTTGTDSTFVLTFNDNKTCVNLNKNEAVWVSAELYDYKNQRIKLNPNDIVWGWKTSNDSKLLEIGEKDGSKIEIKKAVNSLPADGSNYHILQATLKNWGDYDLIAYLPIPITTHDDIKYISGATQIIYDSYGKVSDTFKNEYRIFKNDGELFEGATWNILNANEKEKRYTPSIITTNGMQYLKPINLYIANTCEKVCIIAKDSNNKILWTQPILIMQNQYPSSMLNKWDGSLSIDEDNSTIMAATIAAGKKNSNNTFSGVVIGECAEDAENSAMTGLWGYHEGIQSFGFRENGTAFIGKSTHGRLEFDGTDGTLSSARWDGDAKEGLFMDFDDGYILMAHTSDGVTNSIIIDSNPDGDDLPAANTIPKRPFKIGSKFSVSWEGTVYSKEGEFEDVKVEGGTLTVGDAPPENLSDPSKIPPYFQVDSTGKLTANKGTFNDVTIIGGTLTVGKPSSDSSDPDKVKTYFKVDSTGQLTANKGIFKHIDVDYGTIDDVDITKADITKASIAGANISNAYLDTSYLGGDYATTKGFTWEINSKMIKTTSFSIQGSGGSAKSINGVCIATSAPSGASSGSSSTNGYLGVYFADIWHADIGAWKFEINKITNYNGTIIADTVKANDFQIDGKSIVDLIDELKPNAEAIAANTKAIADNKKAIDVNADLIDALLTRVNKIEASIKG